MQKQTMVQTVLYNHLVKEISNFFKGTGFERAVLGLSGGIDSAVVASLLVDALGSSNVTGVTMPASQSSQDSCRLAKELSSNLSINLRSINLRHMENYFHEEAMKAFGPEIESSFGVAEENLQARLRMISLYFLANKKNRLVVNTSNMTEYLLGYGTLYGDISGSFSPLGRVGKLMVYQLAEYINRKDKIIPQEIIDRPPSAELAQDQTDESSLGAPYSILDPLSAYIFNEMAFANPSFITNGDSFNPNISEFEIKYGKKFPSIITMQVVVRMKKNAFKMLQSPPPIPLPDSIRWWEMYPEFLAEFQ